MSDSQYLSVSALVCGGGAAGSAAFRDTSRYAHAITVTGSAQYTAAKTGYCGNAIAASGSYLDLAPSTAFAFGAGDWTVEGRFWLNSYSAVPRLLYIGNGGIGIAQLYVTGAGALGCETNNATSSSGGTVPLGAWFHAAVTRSGNTIRVFLNGVQVSTHTESATLGTPTVVRIGNYNYGSYYIDGYIDYVRVTKGVARYTAGFTPPAEAPWAPPAGQDPLFSNVVALLHFDGADGSTTITDSSPSPKTLTTHGAVLSTAQSHYGGASAFFNGTSDYIAWDTPLTAADAGEDFTIELSARAASSPQYGQLLDDSVASPPVQFLLNYLTPYWWNYVSGPGAVALNTWNKIAWVRSGGSVRVYLNGVGGTAVTRTNAVTLRTIGSYNGASEFFSGHIDELRITKGVARYLANYTPSDTAFPDSGVATPVTATGAATLAAVTQAASATVRTPVTASGAATLAAVTQAAIATVLTPIAATGSATLDTFAQSAAAAARVTATGAGAAAAISSAGDASVAWPPILAEGDGWTPWVYGSGYITTDGTVGDFNFADGIGAGGDGIDAFWAQGDAEASISVAVSATGASPVAGVTQSGHMSLSAPPTPLDVNDWAATVSMTSAGLITSPVPLSATGSGTVSATAAGTATTQAIRHASGSATATTTASGTAGVRVRASGSAALAAVQSSSDASAPAVLRPRPVVLSATGQGSLTHPVRGAQASTLTAVRSTTSVALTNRAQGAATATTSSVGHASVRVRAQGAAITAISGSASASAPTPLCSATATAWVTSQGAMGVGVSCVGAATVRIGTRHSGVHTPFRPASRRYWRSA